MALKKCKECGNEVSTKAEACPSCGAPVKAKEMGCFSSLLVIIVVLFIIASLNTGNVENENTTIKKPAKKIAPPARKTKAELRREKIEKHFSAWDGAHRGLEKVIKSSMNDPDSYDHNKTVYIDKGDHLIVTTTFRGKNAFGGVVLNSITAEVDFNGNVLQVYSE